MEELIKGTPIAQENIMVNKMVSLASNPEKRRIIEFAFSDIYSLSPRVVEQIHDHWSLFKKGVAATTKMFTSLDTAVATRRLGEIIIYFGKIKIYSLMKPDEYDAFIRNIQLSQKDKEIYQIILLSERQKVVFLCDKDPEFIQKFIKDTAQHTDYKLKIRSGNNQLEIEDKIVENYDESKKIFEEMASSLIDRYGDIEDIIKLISPKRTNSRNKYLELLLGGDFAGLDQSGTWTHNLGTVVVINQNAPVLIDCNVKDVVGTKVVKKYKKSTEDDRLIIKWVQENPPGNISKADYFQKFLDAKIRKISICQLSSIMFGLGYETDRSTKPPGWKH